jgi:dTDP-4-amino-4,6-dideoxygalactose transaminase
VLPFEPDTCKSIYHLYVIRAPNRDGLLEHLRAHGIHAGLHYPLPVHLQRCYTVWGYQRGSLPITERVAREILSLPMFPGLTPHQQQRVAAALTMFVAGASRHPSSESIGPAASRA